MLVDVFYFICHCLDRATVYVEAKQSHQGIGSSEHILKTKKLLLTDMPAFLSTIRIRLCCYLHLHAQISFKHLYDYCMDTLLLQDVLEMRRMYAFGQLSRAMGPKFVNILGYNSSMAFLFLEFRDSS